MKIVKVIAGWIYILCLPVLLLSASIAWGFNSHWIFQYGFQKYNISQSTGLPTSELDKIADGWTDYINSGDEFWHITVTRDNQTFELFTTDEQNHFKDVKDLVWLDYRLLLVSFIIFLGYALTLQFLRQGQYRRLLARNTVWGSGLAILLIIVLGIGSFIDFDWLFLQLHFLIFTNLNWSAEGYMLLLFPGGFWYDAALICIGFMAVLALLIGSAGIIYLRRKSGEKSIDN